mmetsp:Transcript_13521/g.19339  ORF Transcript_13521/g.19339 Transcript_13521/m.19339 type:complete len:703 (-) Transcript_13521:200-2308(-)
MDKNDEETNTQQQWDHTNRKVIVYNMLKFSKPRELKALTTAWAKDASVTIQKYKKPTKVNWCAVTLENKDMVDKFMEVLNDGRHTNKKGGVLYARKAANNGDDSNGGGDAKNKRGSIDGNEKDITNKRRRLAMEACVKSSDEVRDVITPLWRLSYKEQLDIKSRNLVFKCLSRIKSEIKYKFSSLAKEAKRNPGRMKSLPTLFEWLKGDKLIKLEEILPAPRIYEYRNKCELNFGYKHSYEEEESVEQHDENDVNGTMSDQKDESKTNEVSSNGDKETNSETTKRKITKTPAVGFMASGWSGGVSDPHSLQNIPDYVCGLADIINEFLRDSPLLPYNSRDHTGFWRTMTVRTSERTCECMIVVCHAPVTGAIGDRHKMNLDGVDSPTESEVDGRKKIFEKERERMIKVLTDNEGILPLPCRDYPSNQMDFKKSDEYHPKDVKVSSIFFQEFEGLSNPTPAVPVQHLYGKKSIDEKLLKCTFQISPGSFFQVTTEGAEVLYNVVIDRLKEVTMNPEETLLFDVCCGTGTIGLSCLKEKSIGRIVGIDMSQPAIDDAIINAERNGFGAKDEETDDEKVAKFVASRAEAAMYEEVHKVRNKLMVAVVDPARDGLHTDVIRTLRNEERIKRIIYVSCNPTGSLVKDAAVLCSPCTKKYHGMPFKISSAQPVDMFPLTNHCEMVMVFDRMTLHECEEKDKLSEPKSE